MMNITVAMPGSEEGRVFDIQLVNLSGDDDLLAALEVADKMMRPEEYAWAAAFKADVDVPKKGPERVAVLRAYIPPEARYGPREQRDVMARVVGIAIKRADPTYDGPVPGDIETFEDVVAALWGTLGKE